MQLHTPTHQLYLFSIKTGILLSTYTSDVVLRKERHSLFAPLQGASSPVAGFCYLQRSVRIRAFQKSSMMLLGCAQVGKRSRSRSRQRPRSNDRNRGHIFGQVSADALLFSSKLGSALIKPPLEPFKLRYNLY